MEDQNFDKLFAQKMGQVAGKSPDEGEWAGISARLDAHDRRRSRWVLPIFLPLFALLAGGNVFWWQAWRDAESRFSNFSNQKNAVVVADTVVRRTVVFQYDTVFKTVEIRRRVREVFENELSGKASNFSKNGNLENPTAGSTPNFSEKNNPKNSTTADGDPNFFKNKTNETPALTSENGASQNAEIQKLQSKIAALETRNAELETQRQTTTSAPQPLLKHQTDTVIHIHRTDDSLFQNLLAQREIEKSRRQPQLFLASPDVGVAAGIGFPSVPGKISGFGRHLGLAASVEVMRGLRATAGFSRQTTSIKSDDTTILPPASVPNPGGDFKLKYWEVYKMTSWDWSAGLRYEWQNRLIFKPFAGLSLRQWRVRPFETEFEFVNDQNSIELHQPVEIEHQKSYIGWSASVGGNVWLSRRMGFGSEFFWRSGERRQVLPGWVFGFDTRLFYRFGK